MPRIIQEYREEVRERIVKAAFALFLENGYQGNNRVNINSPAERDKKDRWD